LIHRFGSCHEFIPPYHAGGGARWQKYSRFFQHLSSPAPGRGSSGVHEWGFGRFNPETLSLSNNAIPTLQVVDDTFEKYRDVMAELFVGRKRGPRLVERSGTGKQRISRGWTRTNADQNLPVVLFLIRVYPRESAAKYNRTDRVRKQTERIHFCERHYNENPTPSHVDCAGCNFAYMDRFTTKNCCAGRWRGYPVTNALLELLHHIGQMWQRHDEETRERIRRTRVGHAHEV